MKKRMRQYLGTICVSAFAFLVGCAGDDVGFGQNALAYELADDAFDAHTLLLGDVAPLATISAERWESAFAGCEGLLNTVEEYGVAENQPELIVGLDVTRSVVCVDTYASVENELGTQSSDDVDALWLGYVAALQTLEAEHSDTNDAPDEDQDEGRAEDCVDEPTMATPLVDLSVVSGDPDPQPSRPDVVDALMDHVDVDFPESDAP